MSIQVQGIKSALLSMVLPPVHWPTIQPDDGTPHTTPISNPNSMGRLWEGTIIGDPYKFHGKSGALDCWQQKR